MKKEEEEKKSRQASKREGGKKENFLPLAIVIYWRVLYDDEDEAFDWREGREK